MIPDADVIAFRFGIPYSHWLGIGVYAFNFILCFISNSIFTFLYRKNLRLIRYLLLWFVFLYPHFPRTSRCSYEWWTWSLSLLSFSTERFFFDFRPIQVSPIGKRFFSEAGLRVLQSEFI